MLALMTPSANQSQPRSSPALGRGLCGGKPCECWSWFSSEQMCVGAWWLNMNSDVTVLENGPVVHWFRGMKGWRFNFFTFPDEPLVQRWSLEDVMEICGTVVKMSRCWGERCHQFTVNKNRNMCSTDRRNRLQDQ